MPGYYRPSNNRNLAATNDNGDPVALFELKSQAGPPVLSRTIAEIGDDPGPLPQRQSIPGIRRCRSLRLAIRLGTTRQPCDLTRPAPAPRAGTSADNPVFPYLTAAVCPGFGCLLTRNAVALR